LELRIAFNETTGVLSTQTLTGTNLVRYLSILESNFSRLKASSLSAKTFLTMRDKLHP